MISTSGSRSGERATSSCASRAKLTSWSMLAYSISSGFDLSEYHVKTHQSALPSSLPVGSGCAPSCGVCVDGAAISSDERTTLSSLAVTHKFRETKAEQRLERHLLSKHFLRDGGALLGEKCKVKSDELVKAQKYGLHTELEPVLDSMAK